MTKLEVYTTAGSKTDPRRITAVVRREKIFRMKLKGWNNAQIAWELAISRQAVYKQVKRFLGQAPARALESAEEYRLLEADGWTPTRLPIQGVARRGYR